MYGRFACRICRILSGVYVLVLILLLLHRRCRYRCRHDTIFHSPHTSALRPLVHLFVVQHYRYWVFTNNVRPSNATNHCLASSLNVATDHHFTQLCQRNHLLVFKYWPSKQILSPTCMITSCRGIASAWTATPELQLLLKWLSLSLNQQLVTRPI